MLSFLNGTNDGFKNLHVASAAAKIAGEASAYFGSVRIWIAFEQINRGQHHARGADAALCAAAIDECLLDRV